MPRAYVTLTSEDVFDDAQPLHPHRRRWTQHVGRLWSPINMLTDVPRKGEVMCSLFLLWNVNGLLLFDLWILFITFLQDNKYAAFIVSVTHKVGALWAAGEPLFCNVTSSLSLPLCSCVWLMPVTAGKAGHVCDYLSNNGQWAQSARHSHVTELILAPSTHCSVCTLTLSPLLASACRNHGYLWAFKAADLYGMFLQWPCLTVTRVCWICAWWLVWIHSFESMRFIYIELVCSTYPIGGLIEITVVAAPVNDNV